MAMVDANVGVMRCEICQKLNKGIEVMKALSWGEITSLLGFDHETGTILVNEKELMRLIQLVNPIQKARPIRLASRDEIRQAKNRRTQPTE